MVACPVVSAAGVGGGDEIASGVAATGRGVTAAAGAAGGSAGCGGKSGTAGRLCVCWRGVGETAFLGGSGAVAAPPPASAAGAVASVSAMTSPSFCPATATEWRAVWTVH